MFKKFNNKRKYLRKLNFFYKKYIFSKKNQHLIDPHINGLSIVKPKRQIHTILFCNKIFVYSAGLITKKVKITMKHYKKTKKVNTNIILFLQNNDMYKFKYLYFLIIKNFTYSIWNFMEKLWTLTNCNVFFFIHKQTYNWYKRPIKRIKKKIVKLLKKQ